MDLRRRAEPGALRGLALGSSGTERGRGGGWARPMLAAIAFLGHAPGLKVLTRCRFTPMLVRINAAAVVLTLVAMALAGIGAAEAERGWAIFVAWVVGHFAWSTIFAGWILCGGAVRSD